MKNTNVTAIKMPGYKNSSFVYKKIANFILFGFLITFLIAFMITDALYFKIAASLCFVTDGLLHFERSSQKSMKFPLFLEIGLFFSLLGDYFIYTNFVFGAIAFACAHIMYLISYYSIHRFHKNDLIFGFLIFLISTLVIIFTPMLVFETTTLLFLCLIYSLIISIMTGKAINNHLIINNRFSLIVSIGAVIFLSSDIMVLFNTFNEVPEKGQIFKHIGHALYFPGQFLLAQSIKLYFMDGK